MFRELRRGRLRRQRTLLCKTLAEEKFIPVTELSVSQMARTPIPTPQGLFELALYRSNQDEKDHLILLHGEWQQKPDLLVRIHSECQTGDIFGSLRCDCGPQLEKAMALIAEAGAGAIVYLRQEGRGIGLLEKLRAYNLQDKGYDTLDANVMLGHEPDGRDYSIAALILQDLGIRALRLMTNNPAKVEALESQQLAVLERVSLQTPIHKDNRAYLQTKRDRMRHILKLDARKSVRPSQRPFVTMSYAQSLDGSITVARGQSLAISGPQSMEMTHRLRADHDGILIGVGTLLADDPSLTVRLVNGEHPQPIILDSRLSFPLDAKLWTHPVHKPWIATVAPADPERKRRLEGKGARVIELPGNQNGKVSLPHLLDALGELGVERLMVEGGALVITDFLLEQLVNRVVITVAPMFVGGLNAVGSLTSVNGKGLPSLINSSILRLGQDMVLTGDVAWENQTGGETPA